MNTKKLKLGGFSIAVTIIFITVAVLFNVVVNTLLSRFDIRADLTEKRLYSIEKNTAVYLSSIDDVVNFYFCNELFSEFGTPYKQAVEIAERFTEANRKFTITFIDRLTNPMFASKYGGNLTDTDIIIESENTGRYRVIKNTDYIITEFSLQGQTISYEEASFYAQYYNAPIEVSTSAGTEEAYLSAVMFVTNLSPTRIAFTDGFVEGTISTDNPGKLYSSLIELLEKNSYIIEVIDMFTIDEIDDEIDFLIIYTPLSDFSNSALEKIEKWLDNNTQYGKTLFYFPSARDDIRIMPNLEAFMAEWGLKVENGYVKQSNPAYASASTDYYEQYVHAPGTFSENVGEKPFVGVFMRPVTILFESYMSFHTMPLIIGYDGTYFAPFDNTDNTADSELFEETLTVAAMSQKRRVEKNEVLVSNVLMFGSPYFFFPDYVETEQFSNLKFLTNMFSELSGREEQMIFLAPKSFRMTRFEIDRAQANSIALVFTVVLPLLIIVSGLVVFFRRRYR